MERIDSYEKFCEAFQREDEQTNRAELMLLLRDWIIRISGRSDPDETGLDQLLETRTDFDKPDILRKDALSRVAEASLPPFRYIVQHMREKILRENVKLPVHKVREVNSGGMIWLSRYPGDTVRQKLSSAKGMMAVQRRMSLDTGENRLFVAFLRELSDLLTLKLTARPDPEEEDLLGLLLAFLRREELEEIRQWENLPPNNTLLSDPQYKKIWSGWNALRLLDEFVQQDDERLPERMCTLFFIELLRQIQSFATLPQLPVRVNYEQYQVVTPELFALDASGQRLELRRDGNRLEIRRSSDIFTVRFTQKEIFSSVDSASYSLDQQGLVMCLEDLLFALHDGGLEQDLPEMPEPVDLAEAVVDPFVLYPNYLPLSRKGEPSTLPARIMIQEYRMEDTVYQLPCHRSRGVILDENTDCCTIHSAMNAEDQAGLAQKLNRLTRLLASHLTTPRLIFLFPDVYTDFQLSLLHRGLRVAYQEVRSLPRSIGAAFFCQSQPGFSDFFRDGGFLLLLDLVGDELTMTLVQGQRRSDLGALSLVWERHPTTSVPLQNKMQERLDGLYRNGCQEGKKVFSLLGVQGLQDEAKDGRQMTFFFPDGGHYTLTTAACPDRFRLDISGQVEDFLNQCRNIVGNAPVCLYSFSRSFIYGKSARRNLTFRYLDSKRALEGCRILEDLQRRTDIPLWQDHLPELSIKLLHGMFPLIDRKSITPRFGQRVQIDVQGTFTLPKSNADSYQFDLIQSNANRRSQFVAVVNSSMFPLREDVECRLELWYEYGEENPFKLFFRPLDPARAGFAQANVTWKPRSEAPHPWKNLPAPGALSSPGWKAMERHQGRYGTVDIPTELTKYFREVLKGYTYLDLRRDPPELKGEPGNWTFTYRGIIDGEAVSVHFSEKNLDPKAKARADIARLPAVSFQLQEIPPEPRYRCRLTANRNTGQIWSPNQRAVMAHTERNVKIKGEPCQVVLCEDQFDGEFHDSIRAVTFEVAAKPKRYPDGTLSYLATHIRDAEDEGPVYKSYWAKMIRTYNCPSSWIYGSRVRFQMLSVFPTGLRLSDPECPRELWETFCQAREKWMDMYEECDHQQVKNSLFELLSLTAYDLGDRYYRLAEQRIQNFDRLNKTHCWSDRIGYALYDCSLERERKLLDQLCAIPNRNEVVRILAKAIWGHPDFILNVPTDQLLKNFYTAIEYIGELYHEWMSKRGQDRLPDKYDKSRILTGIQSCFEYCLGVFRLRSLGDAILNKKLSLNHPRMLCLYKYTEQIIDDIEFSCKVPLHTFLELKIPDKKQYANISDLAYAMLVYVTGREEGDAIQISGISNQDDEYI